ncbi:MAG: DUF2922 domain-containing protein [Defluviitaleaceae bacterium]|nr:DUF2922 domain-containing protein [Defluviitaleaceae bacterium]
MTASNRAVLTFNSNIGEIVRISIPRADIAKTSASARTSMEAMIAGNTILAKGGTPSSIRGAEIVKTTRTPIVPVA